MHIKYLCDNKTGLFYHGWTFNEMNNFGGIFWCRGNSWFTLGILDYVDMFKGTLNSGVKEIIIDASTKASIVSDCPYAIGAISMFL